MRKFIRGLSPQQFFLLLLPFAFLFAVVVLFVSSSRYLSQRDCGCNLSSKDPTGKFDPQKEIAYFNNKPVNYPFAQLNPSQMAQRQTEERVLGVTDDDRWIEIDLSEQKIFAHEGNKVTYEFLISSGKPWTPTVTGEFRVQTKLRYSKMSGGSKENGTYYYLPNVPYIQYFHQDYGLHGAYWHQNFGQTMSHGCVNLSVLDAEKLFHWTSPIVSPGEWVARSSKKQPGTRIVIHE
ncbi:L,D-transpeptidase [Patescibacteria group bacterium]